MPYVLLRQDANPDSWMARAGDSVDIIELRTASKLKAVHQQPLKIELGLEGTERTDFFESPYFIVSARMREALSAVADNIDYYPVILEKEDGSLAVDGYFLGNVLGRVSCVDEANSQYKMLSGSRRILRGFAVDEASARDLALFRLAEHPGLVLIADRVRKRLEDAGLNGLYFQDTLKFDGEPVSSFWED